MPDMNVGDAMFFDNRWIETVQHRPENSVSNEGGYASDDDGAITEVDALIRSAEGREWGVITEGRTGESEQYFMIVQNEQGVENNDEIKYHGEWYRAVEPAVDFQDGFSVFSLFPLEG